MLCGFLRIGTGAARQPARHLVGRAGAMSSSASRERASSLAALSSDVAAGAPATASPKNGRRSVMGVPRVTKIPSFRRSSSGKMSKRRDLRARGARAGPARRGRRGAAQARAAAQARGARRAPRGPPGALLLGGVARKRRAVHGHVLRRHRDLQPAALRQRGARRPSRGEAEERRGHAAVGPRAPGLLLRLRADGRERRRAAGLHLRAADRGRPAGLRLRAGGVLTSSAAARG